MNVVLPDRVDGDSADAIRAALDRFNVAGRLQHVREFVWRGGQLRLRADRCPGSPLLDIAYALTATWPAAVLEPPSHRQVSGMLPWDRPVLDGRWVRGATGYELRVGIDGSVPSAIYLRAPRLLAYVPFLGRPREQVEEALNGELTAYVNAFLSRCLSVPDAAARDAVRLRRLGLAA